MLVFQKFKGLCFRSFKRFRVVFQVFQEIQGCVLRFRFVFREFQGCVS